MQRKHILLASKVKHFSTSQVKISGYIKAKSCSWWMTQYMTGNFTCRLIAYVTCRAWQCSRKKRRKTLVTGGFARPLTWCLHNAIVTAISRKCNCSCSSHTTTVSPSIARIKHGFVRLSVWLSHQLYKFKPITSTSDMTWLGLASIT